MPVGTVDYVSTAPWNDPMNPWPAYAQLQLSAADIQGGALLTYTLAQFDPALPGGAMFYSANTEEGNYLTYDDTHWKIIAQEELEYYRLLTGTRAIPQGFQQGNTDWVPVEGSDENTISIMPVTTYLTPWEYRRRRLLEIC
jgi:hypothetical protein